jgi:hypothetical protein
MRYEDKVAVGIGVTMDDRLIIVRDTISNGESLYFPRVYNINDVSSVRDYEDVLDSFLLSLGYPTHEKFKEMLSKKIDE